MVAIILMVVGISMWSYWTGWYQANRACDTNWVLQSRSIMMLAKEFSESPPGSPQFDTLKGEMLTSCRRYDLLHCVSGQMYSGHGVASRQRFVGLVCCVIGLGFLLAAIIVANYHSRSAGVTNELHLPKTNEQKCQSNNPAHETGKTAPDR